MSLGQKTLSGFVWVFLSRIGTQVSTLIIGIVLARLLAPEAFGLVAMLYIFFEVSGSFVNSGFSQALIRENRLSEADKSTTFSVNIIVSLFFYGMLWVCAPYIADFYDQPILTDLTRFMGLNVLVQAPTIVQRAALTQALRFKTLSLINVSATFASGLVAIVLAYQGYGVWSLAAKYVITSLILTILLYTINPWRPKQFIVRESFNRLFGFGSKLLASGLLDSIFRNIYKVVIGKAFSPLLLGFYTHGQLYVNQATQGAVGTLQTVTYPILSKTKDDAQRLRQAYRKIILASSFVIFPATIGLAIVAEPLILTLVGKKWLTAVPFLQLFCVAGLHYHLRSINLNILKVVGRSDLFLRLEIIKKVIISIAIAIGLQFGIWGLLTAQVISSYSALFINMNYTKRFIEYSEIQQLQDLVPLLFYTLPMSAVVFGIVAFIDMPAIVLLLAGIIAGIVVYLATTILLKAEALRHIQTLLGSKWPLLNCFSL